MNPLTYRSFYPLVRTSFYAGYPCTGWTHSVVYRASYVPDSRARKLGFFNNF